MKKIYKTESQNTAAAWTIVNTADAVPVGVTKLPGYAETTYLIIVLMFILT